MKNLKKSFYFTASLILCAFSLEICFGVDDNLNMEDPVIIPEHAAQGHLYPKDTNLSKGVHLWVIEPNETKHHPKSINLFFDTLFLHEEDLVTVFKNLNESTNISNSIIEPIQAQNGSVTVITDLLSLVVKLEGNSTNFIRTFSCYYSSDNCVFTLKPELHIIHSPIYMGNRSSVDCKYMHVYDPKIRRKPAFHFEVFNYTSSTVDLEQTTYPGTYNKMRPMDFFPLEGHNSMSITVHVNNKDEYFRLTMRQVDSSCSDYIKISNTLPTFISSPSYMLDNGTFGNECLWVIEHEDNKQKLGVAFTHLYLSSALDLISIIDGATLSSQPLFQVTVNTSMNQFLRSSGPFLWINFKPINFISEMKANITVHGQGGHYSGSGHLSMEPTTGNDTIFTLDVKKNEIVMLNFTSSDFKSPATLTVYEGSDLHNVIATLHGNIWYPILSQSSKMMLIATSFKEGKFEADFKGISPGCIHMSTLTDEEYVLSGNCNNTCMWIIPPQNINFGSDLLLHIQYLSLSDKDRIEMFKLDAERTPIGSIDVSQSHVPTLSIPASVGLMVQITRKECSKPDDVVLVGHSSLIPVCGGTLNLKSTEHFHISSPFFPDTYPLFSKCNWTLVTPKESFVHLTFGKVSLAPGHCVRVFNSLKRTTSEYTGSELPDDLFVSNGSIVEFISDKCKAVTEQLVSSQGFTLNGTVAECGSVLDGKLSGSLTINVTQTLCVWKISVPPTTDGSVNVIAYNISVKQDKGNYELKIFDGATVREPQIVNISNSEVWSRKNGILIIYKRLNASLPSSVFNIIYRTIACNSTSLCDNNLCMHPDWVCNGVNDCGDYSDERNCDTSPPIIEHLIGYSSTTFWLTLFCMLSTGVLFGIGGKIFYDKYKNGQYHRFSDISVIE